MNTTPSPAPDVGDVPRAGASSPPGRSSAQAHTAPPNVAVVAAAPHTRVLRHVALVLTHGGHGTLVKSFVAGVPIVVLPHGRDQADDAARVVPHGAGLSVARAASPTRVADGTGTVLEDLSFADGAARLGGALRAEAASALLLAELEAGLSRQPLRKELK
ncbi:nucleotide disphospho-sugar-binding domain-containing protein [Nonomuraea jabiensis]|uniref:glycosyltransferase n=1 Tax=Nonomuraea jabiensis TaxID=882448 RepID=UPI003416BE7C